MYLTIHKRPFFMVDGYLNSTNRIQQKRLGIYVKWKASMQRSYQKTFLLKVENFDAIIKDWNLPQCISDRKDDCKFDFLFLVQYKRSSLPGCYHRYTVLDLLVFSAIKSVRKKTDNLVVPKNFFHAWNLWLLMFTKKNFYPALARKYNCMMIYF